MGRLEVGGTYWGVYKGKLRLFTVQSIETPKRGGLRFAKVLEHTVDPPTGGYRTYTLINLEVVKRTAQAQV